MNQIYIFLLFFGSFQNLITSQIPTNPLPFIIHKIHQPFLLKTLFFSHILLNASKAVIKVIVTHIGLKKVLNVIKGTSHGVKILLMTTLNIRSHDDFILLRGNVVFFGYFLILKYKFSHPQLHFVIIRRHHLFCQVLVEKFATTNCSVIEGNNIFIH